MTLTRTQKLVLVIVLITCVPAYFIANLRFDASVDTLEQAFEREKDLHQSTDKLLQNCERNEQKEAAQYGASRTICDQGAQAHERTERAMSELESRKDHARSQWYQTFGMVVLVLNALVALAFAWRRWAQKQKDAQKDEG
jgi:hypothetical protein